MVVIMLRQREHDGIPSCSRCLNMITTIIVCRELFGYTPISLRIGDGRSPALVEFSQISQIFRRYPAPRIKSAILTINSTFSTNLTIFGSVRLRLGVDAPRAPDQIFAHEQKFSPAQREVLDDLRWPPMMTRLFRRHQMITDDISMLSDPSKFSNSADREVPKLSEIGV